LKRKRCFPFSSNNGHTKEIEFGKLGAIDQRLNHDSYRGREGRGDFSWGIRNKEKGKDSLNPSAALTTPRWGPGQEQGRREPTPSLRGGLRWVNSREGSIQVQGGDLLERQTISVILEQCLQRPRRNCLLEERNQARVSTKGLLRAVSPEKGRPTSGRYNGLARNWQTTFMDGKWCNKT